MRKTQTLLLVVPLLAVLGALAAYEERQRIHQEGHFAEDTDPKTADAFLHRANQYRSKGDYDHAIADLSEVIRLEPSNTSTYFLRALMYELSGHVDPEIGDYTEIIRLDPKNAAAYQRRGSAYRAKGDLLSADADDAEAMRLDPVLRNQANWQEVRVLWADARNRIELKIENLGRQLRRKYADMARTSYEEIIKQLQDDGELSEQAASALLNMNDRFLSLEPRSYNITQQDATDFRHWFQIADNELPKED